MSNEPQETETVLVQDDVAVESESAETPLQIRKVGLFSKMIKYFKDREIQRQSRWKDWLRPVEIKYYEDSQIQRQSRWKDWLEPVESFDQEQAKMIKYYEDSQIQRQSRWKDWLEPVESFDQEQEFLECPTPSPNLGRSLGYQVCMRPLPPVSLLKLGKLELGTWKDLSNTLATSITKLQALHVLVLDLKMISTGEVEVNAPNAGGLIALHNLNKMIDIKMEAILRRAGGLRARDIKSQPQHSPSQVVIDCETALNQQSPAPVSHKFHEAKIDSPSNGPTLARNAMFLVAAMIATVTYLALNSGAWKEVYSNQSYQNSTSQPWKQNLEFEPIAFNLPMSIRLFAAFNSAGFFTSIAMMVVLISGFPLRPLLLVAAFSLLVSYMSLITAMLPTEVLFVLILAIAVVSFAVTQYIFPRGKWGSGNLLKLKWIILGKLTGV